MSEILSQILVINVRHQTKILTITFSPFLPSLFFSFLWIFRMNKSEDKNKPESLTEYKQQNVMEKTFSFTSLPQSVRKKIIYFCSHFCWIILTRIKITVIITIIKEFLNFQYLNFIFLKHKWSEKRCLFFLSLSPCTHYPCSHCRLTSLVISWAPWCPCDTGNDSWGKG